MPYGNIYHQYTPFMLAYIPAPWILWDMLQAGPGGIWCPKDHDFPLAPQRMARSPGLPREAKPSVKKWPCSIDAMDV